MSKYRLDIIELCFNKADRTGDGVITVEDMKKFYNATKHPKYTSGEWTERRVFQEFLNTFQQDEKDDKVRIYSSLCSINRISVYPEIIARYRDSKDERHLVNIYTN